MEINIHIVYAHDMNVRIVCSHIYWVHDANAVWVKCLKRTIIFHFSLHFYVLFLFCFSFSIVTRNDKTAAKHFAINNGRIELNHHCCWNLDKKKGTISICSNLKWSRKRIGAIFIWYLQQTYYIRLSIIIIVFLFRWFVFLLQLKC